MHSNAQNINIVAYTGQKSSLKLSGSFISTVTGRYILIGTVNCVSDVVCRLSAYFIYIHMCENRSRNAEPVLMKQGQIFNLCSWRS
jgi:hypothetical protein